MAELRRGLRFTQKARADVVVERELRGERLDRDVTVQPQIECTKDGRHTAASDLALDQILVAHGGDDAVVQIISHGVRPRVRFVDGNVRYGPAVDRTEVRRPIRPISSATYRALSTLSARESASIANDVTF